MRNVLHNELDTELLRSELFSIEQLKRHAISLAGQHRIDLRRRPDRLLPRLADNERVLLAAYDVVTTAATQNTLNRYQNFAISLNFERGCFNLLKFMMENR